MPGKLVFQLETILGERGISKNELCRETGILRTNLNKYCQNRMQRVDLKLLITLMEYLNVGIEDLYKYIPDDTE